MSPEPGQRMTRRQALVLMGAGAVSAAAGVTGLVLGWGSPTRDARDGSSGATGATGGELVEPEVINWRISCSAGWRERSSWYARTRCHCPWNGSGCSWSPTSPWTAIGWRRGDAGADDGREGAPVLVNGQIEPTVTVTPGGYERWRIINACTARFLRLRADGAELLQTAGDAGPLPNPPASAR